MKRFHSNLGKVHALCRQQRRLAELDLARALQVVEQAVQAEFKAQADLTEAHAAANAALARRTTVAAIQSARNDVQRATDVVISSAAVTVRARAALDQQRQKFREIQSREDRLAELISRQRQEHRHEMLRQQQIAMDESAVSRRLSGATSPEEVNSHA